jgi:integral membrane protein
MRRPRRRRDEQRTVAGGVGDSHDAWPVKFLHTLRLVAILEAVSYLVLGGAMVLKYWYAMPSAIRIPGMVHGLLFLVLIWLLLRAHFEAHWPRQRLWLVMAASLVPLWPFFLDRRVREWIAATPGT